MAVLVVVEGDCERRAYPVPEEGELTIGRALENSLVLTDPAVSRRHARVFREGGDCIIEDLQSSNGTQVNGQFIERHTLQPGDLVEIGHYRFRFSPETPDQTEEAEHVEEKAKSADSKVILEDDRPQATVAQRRADRTLRRTGAAVLAKVDTRKVAAADVAADAQSLRRKLRSFQAFVDATGTLLDLDAILEKTLDSLFNIFTQTERAFVLLVEEGTGRLVPRAVRNTTPDARREITVSRTIVEEAIREGKSILMADAASDQRFGRARSVVNLRIRSAMCVPLVSSNRTYGIIYLDTTSARARFTEEDLYILAGIGAQAARAIENANLHAQLLRNKLRERDLALASEVQRSFLPSTLPNLAGYEFFVHYSPAFEVGGDFYDFIELSGDRLVLIIGDVSGKGFSAALLMAKLLSDLRHAALTQPGPSAVLEEVNRTLCYSAGEAFVTLLYLALDPASGGCTVGNAGHMPPLVVRADGTLEEPPSSGGLPLGVDSQTHYQTDSLLLAPGDCVLLYTDGISEARNLAGEYFGSHRLRAALTDLRPSSPAQLARHLLGILRRFVGRTAQSDDITLLAFGRTD